MSGAAGERQRQAPRRSKPSVRSALQPYRPWAELGRNESTGFDLNPRFLRILGIVRYLTHLFDRRFGVRLPSGHHHFLEIVMPALPSDDDDGQRRRPIERRDFSLRFARCVFVGDA